MLGWFKKKLNKQSEDTSAENLGRDVSNKIAKESSPAPSTDSISPEVQSEQEAHLEENNPEAFCDTDEDVSLAKSPAPAEAAEEVPPSPSTVESEHPALIPENRNPRKPASVFKRLTESLSRTRESFTVRIDELFLGKKQIDADLFDDLEEILITADLGIATTQEVLEFARKRVKRDALSDPQALKDLLKTRIKGFITANDKSAEMVMPESGPFVIMVVGVNGVGKTTTIGKITKKFLRSGQSVLLVAADTFRAAAVSQLKIWGERNNVRVIAHQEGADPSSVVFDGLAVAKSKNYDVVLVDTAGRLHTRANLMEELKKIKRVIGKQLEDAPHEILLVIDATTGQNGISQATLFNEAVGVTGIALTKLDGTAKGGIVANIARELKMPIRFIGVGEQVDDLRDFDADEFVEALFESEPRLPHDNH